MCVYIYIYILFILTNTLIDNFSSLRTGALLPKMSFETSGAFDDLHYPITFHAHEIRFHGFGLINSSDENCHLINQMKTIVPSFINTEGSG